MTRRAAFTTAVAFVMSLAARPAAAQDVVGPRAFDGLFGGSAGNSSATHSVDATVSAAGAYHTNGGERFAQEAPGSVFETSGSHEDLAGTLGYRWSGQRVQIGATVGANAMYFNQQRQFVRVNDYGGFGVAATLGRRTQVFANQGVNCGPLHFQRMFPSGGTVVPGAVPSVGVDFSLDELRACTYDTTASLTYGIAARSSVEISSGLRQTHFDAESGLRDLQSYSVGGRFLHNLTRNTRLRLGYTQSRGEYGFVTAGAATTVHNLDVGFDSGRALSLTRRTYLEVGIGSTIVSSPGAIEFVKELEYRVVGNATLNHEMGRSWRGRVGYSRGVHFIDGFAAPAFIDSVNGSLTGFLNRRVEFSSAIGYSSGDVHAGDTGTLRAYTGHARLRVALARAWAVFGEYTYYSYDVPTAGVLVGVPQSLDRQTARVGLTWWLPLLRK